MQQKTRIACAGLLLIGAAGIATAVRALPCSLTENDMRSLAHPICDDCKPVTERDFDSLSPEDQASVCEVRQFYAVFHEKLTRGFESGQIADFIER